MAKRIVISSDSQTGNQVVEIVCREVGADLGETVRISGLLIASSWNDRGAKTGYSIATDDEKEYQIEPGWYDAELEKNCGARVVAEGWLMNTGGTPELAPAIITITTG